MYISFHNENEGMNNKISGNRMCLTQFEIVAPCPCGRLGSNYWRIVLSVPLLPSSLSSQELHTFTSTHTILVPLQAPQPVSEPTAGVGSLTMYFILCPDELYDVPSNGIFFYVSVALPNVYP